MRRRAFLACVGAATAGLAGCGHRPDELAWRFDAGTVGDAALAGDRLVVTAVSDGEARLVALDTATGSVSYERPVAFEWRGRAAPPVAAAGDGETLLVWAKGPGLDGGLVAVDAATGETRWRVRSPPAVPATDGRAAYVADSGGVRALELGTGVERWRASPDGAGSAPRPLAAVPGRVLVSVGVGVVALASATGAPRWRVDRAFLNRAPVGAGRATVYVGAAAAEPDGNPGAVPVSAHDAETGARRWRLLLDGVAAVPQAAPRGAYVNTIRDQGRALYALRPGGTSWRVDGLELPGGAFAGDRLFAVAPGEAVVGVTAAGTEAWRHGLPTDLPGDHPLVVPVGGRPVVVAGATATALAPGDGATLWSYDAGAPVRSAVAGDGRAYLLTTDAVHALTLPGP